MVICHTYDKLSLLGVFFLLQAYEKGISLFKWPNVYDIWNTYLTKFIERYVSLFGMLFQWLMGQDKNENKTVQ